jgi:hypothetical protein
MINSDRAASSEAYAEASAASAPPRKRTVYVAHEQWPGGREHGRLDAAVRFEPAARVCGECVVRPPSRDGSTLRLDAVELLGGDDRFVAGRVTHAEDDAFVVLTSFNWLSFRGDADRTFRDEQGVIVSDPERVEHKFRELAPWFDDPPKD